MPVISVTFTRAEGYSGFIVRMSGFPACTQYPSLLSGLPAPPSHVLASHLFLLTLHSQRIYIFINARVKVKCVEEAQGTALSFEWVPTVEQPKTVSMADQSTAPQLWLMLGTIRALALNGSLRSEWAEPAVGRPAAHPSMTPLFWQVTKVFSLFSLSQPQHLERLVHLRWLCPGS